MLALVGGATALTFVPTGNVAIEPHQPIDLAGSVIIDGKQTPPVNGRIFLVGVEERQLNQLQQVLLRFDSKVTIEPDPYQGMEQIQENRDKAAIVDSKDYAAAVAFDLLGEKVEVSGAGAIVEEVATDGPANGLLKVGDQVVRINGKTVHTSVDLVRAVGSYPPGTRVTLGVRRDNLPYVFKIATAPPLPGDDLHKSRLGLNLNTPGLKIHLPHEVKIESKNVVGPSAGLAFALAIYDARSASDLFRGRYIVATGALSLEGQVLEIGAVRQKAISAVDGGAEIFLVPKANVADAQAAVKEFCHRQGQCTRIVGVSSVSDAIDVLKLSPEALDARAANP